MSKRKQIEMSEDEVAAFLRDGRTMNVATNGREGYPHLVAMWYGFSEGKPAFWTYGKSQKIRNLERDNRITCLIETGDRYDQLGGVMKNGRTDSCPPPSILNVVFSPCDWSTVHVTSLATSL